MGGREGGGALPVHSASPYIYFNLNTGSGVSLEPIELKLLPLPLLPPSLLGSEGQL